MNIQVTPYVFNAFVFQNLLGQKFFETRYYIYSISGLIIILLNLILILFTEKNTEQLSTTPASPSSFVPELYCAPHSSHETASTILRPPINTDPKRKTKRFYKKEDEEKLLRIQKIKEAIEQQNELHQIRMASAIEEFFVATANAKLVASKLTNEQLQEVQKIVKERFTETRDN
jgi:hypothetical protein